MIVSVFIIMFVLFYIQQFSYFRCKYVIKRSVQYDVFHPRNESVIQYTLSNNSVL